MAEILKKLKSASGLRCALSLLFSSSGWVVDCDCRWHYAYVPYTDSATVITVSQVIKSEMVPRSWESSSVSISPICIIHQADFKYGLASRRQNKCHSHLSPGTIFIYRLPRRNVPRPKTNCGNLLLGELYYPRYKYCWKFELSVFSYRTQG